MTNLMRNDIIRIPKRDFTNEITFDKNNQINYWHLYEKTYLEKDVLININNTNLNLENISEFLDYVHNIKYNWHNSSSEDIQTNILKVFIESINSSKASDLSNLHKEIFNLNKKNKNLINVYFKCMSLIFVDNNLDKSSKNIHLLSNTINTLNNLINSNDLSKIDMIIKVNLQLDKFMDHIPKNSENIKSYILDQLIKGSFGEKIKECFEKNFDKAVVTFVDYSGYFLN